MKVDKTAKQGVSGSDRDPMQPSGRERKLGDKAAMAAEMAITAAAKAAIMKTF